MTPYYQDEAVTLWHGDCREILPTVGVVDHLISDPPYARDVYLRAAMPNTKLGSGTPDRIGVGALSKLAAGEIGVMDEELMRAVGWFTANYLRRWCVVFSDVESIHLWRDALTNVRTPEGARHCGLRYIRTGIWRKTDYMPQMSGDRPAVGFEPCTIAHAMNGFSDSVPMRWNGGGKAAAWEYGTAKVNRPDHPCPKPEVLMLELITDFTDKGDLILDPFGGSGTTAVAAKRLGRRCILIEREEKYCEVAARRLSQGALDLFAPEPKASTEDMEFSA